MANLKLQDNMWEVSGVYDINQQKTQRQINTDVATAFSQLDEKVTKFCYRPASFSVGSMNTNGGNATNNTRARTTWYTFKANMQYTIRSNGLIEYRVALLVSPGESSAVDRWLNDWTSEQLDIPIDASDRYYRILARVKNAPTSNITDLSAIADGIQIEITFPKNILNGLTFSLLGDSMSAYTGTVPEGYDIYYTGENAGLQSKTFMWWHVFAELLGLTPLVINAYSGSAITQLEDANHVSKIPMSSNERCAGLAKDGVTPDIIFIAGGTNDYTYAQSAQSEPLPWDGKTAPVEGASFTETYACMVKKLQTNYPNALIVALSTWFTMRGTDNGYTLTHTVGSNVYTQQDYDEAIKFVADQMHIAYLDISKIGFNRNNYYPNFAQDSETTPTHMNRNGHEAVGAFIAKHLPDIADAFQIGWISRDNGGRYA